MQWCQAVGIAAKVQTSRERAKTLRSTYSDYVASCETQRLYFVACPVNTDVVLSEDFLRSQFKQADGLLANFWLQLAFRPQILASRLCLWRHKGAVDMFLISNVRRVLNLNVCILLGISPASD